ncbi:hypothetical protein QBC34DRAFT_121846 [Podospora aff. communis PSN243]|uniref:Uncharacterized protein n=1 Tax=Podospora aff. communis PSN243 TaxID=3040156 RepID=A0AAV9GIB2_9PEZI|nr:hypothetical protein QBC34DRAFT_121846 [Podospora aff. communis PSN243]
MEAAKEIARDLIRGRKDPKEEKKDSGSENDPKGTARRPSKRRLLRGSDKGSDKGSTPENKESTVASIDSGEPTVAGASASPAAEVSKSDDPAEDKPSKGKSPETAIDEKTSSPSDKAVQKDKPSEGKSPESALAANTSSPSAKAVQDDKDNEAGQMEVPEADKDYPSQTKGSKSPASSKKSKSSKGGSPKAEVKLAEGGSSPPAAKEDSPSPKETVEGEKKAETSSPPSGSKSAASPRDGGSKEESKTDSPSRASPPDPSQGDDDNGEEVAVKPGKVFPKSPSPQRHGFANTPREISQVSSDLSSLPDYVSDPPESPRAPPGRHPKVVTPPGQTYMPYEAYFELSTDDADDVPDFPQNTSSERLPRGIFRPQTVISQAKQDDDVFTDSKKSNKESEGEPSDPSKAEYSLVVSDVKRTRRLRLRKDPDTPAALFRAHIMEKRAKAERAWQPEPKMRDAMARTLVKLKARLANEVLDSKTYNEIKKLIDELDASGIDLSGADLSGADATEAASTGPEQQAPPTAPPEATAPLETAAVLEATGQETTGQEATSQQATGQQATVPAEQPLPYGHEPLTRPIENPDELRPRMNISPGKLARAWDRLTSLNPFTQKPTLAPVDITEDKLIAALSPDEKTAPVGKAADKSARVAPAAAPSGAKLSDAPQPSFKPPEQSTVAEQEPTKAPAVPSNPLPAFNFSDSPPALFQPTKPGFGVPGAPDPDKPLSRRLARRKKRLSFERILDDAIARTMEPISVNPDKKTPTFPDPRFITEIVDDLLQKREEDPNFSSQRSSKRSDRGGIDISNFMESVINELPASRRASAVSKAGGGSRKASEDKTPRPFSNSRPPTTTDRSEPWTKEEMKRFNTSFHLRPSPAARPAPTAHPAPKPENKIYPDPSDTDLDLNRPIEPRPRDPRSSNAIAEDEEDFYTDADRHIGLGPWAGHRPSFTRTTGERIPVEFTYDRDYDRQDPAGDRAPPERDERVNWYNRTPPGSEDGDDVIEPLTQRTASDAAPWGSPGEFDWNNPDQGKDESKPGEGKPDQGKPDDGKPDEGKPDEGTDESKEPKSSHSHKHFWDEEEGDRCGCVPEGCSMRFLQLSVLIKRLERGMYKDANAKSKRTSEEIQEVRNQVTALQQRLAETKVLERDRQFNLTIVERLANLEEYVHASAEAAAKAERRPVLGRGSKRAIVQPILAAIVLLVVNWAGARTGGGADGLHLQFPYGSSGHPTTHAGHFNIYPGYMHNRWPTEFFNMVASALVGWWGGYYAAHWS